MEMDFFLFGINDAWWTDHLSQLYYYECNGFSKVASSRRVGFCHLEFAGDWGMFLLYFLMCVLPTVL